MSHEEISTIVRVTLDQIEEDKKNSSSIIDVFINGLFKFIIPALITFAASYLALEKSVELMQLKFDLKIEQCEKDFNNHKIDNEKQFDEFHRKNYEQDKDFNEFVKDYYKQNPSVSQLSQKF